ncbi:hypothetical protein UCRNP2_9308 [Neofusicoccum parvum UCRNP2]|uniref:SAP domain-containing protein n=1 Tax=Botryosphaeria parva (strain UCR-NP2) TaxID=1287680 RepID=R1E9C6_BOTPV|nr:hypothetical protein UCRNP2_9308 [Neofusicoccum parvum UCRNP2]
MPAESSSCAPSNKATQTLPITYNLTTSGTQTVTPSSGSNDQTPNPINRAAGSTMLPLVLSPDYNCGQCASTTATARSNNGDTTSLVRDSAASPEPNHAGPVQPQLSVGLWTKPKTAEDLLPELEAATRKCVAAEAAMTQQLEDLEAEKKACLKFKEDVVKLIEKAVENMRVLEGRASDYALADMDSDESSLKDESQVSLELQEQDDPELRIIMMSGRLYRISLDLLQSCKQRDDAMTEVRMLRDEAVKQKVISGMKRDTDTAQIKDIIQKLQASNTALLELNKNFDVATTRNNLLVEKVSALKISNTELTNKSFESVLTFPTSSGNMKPYEQMSFKNLKALLQQQGLDDRGKKKHLVRRLEKSDGFHAGFTAAAAVAKAQQLHEVVSNLTASADALHEKVTRQESTIDGLTIKGKITAQNAHTKIIIEEMSTTAREAHDRNARIARLSLLSPRSALEKDVFMLKEYMQSQTKRATSGPSQFNHHSGPLFAQYIPSAYEYYSTSHGPPHADLEARGRGLQ